MNSCNSKTKYMAKLLLIISLFPIFVEQLTASPQLPDYIIYKNDTLLTYNLLLEKYLQKKNPDEDKLYGLSFRNPPLEELNMGITVNCWRGYQAIYKIENDSLFLTDIIECHSIRKIDKELSDKNLLAIFGGQVKNGKVFVDWFSGNISFPQKMPNELIRWDDVFENIFLFETLIKVANGKIRYYKDIQNYVDASDRINRKENDFIVDILFDKIKSYKWTKLKKM